MSEPHSPALAALLAAGRRELAKHRTTTLRKRPRKDATVITEPTPDPIPADTAPHAYVALKRYHNVHADRPEWEPEAFTVPEWNHAELENRRRQGYELLPIGPDRDTGTRAITTEAADLAVEVKELRATLAAIKAVDPDLFDPTGGTDRGAAYETYGSAGEELREKFLAAIGVNVNDYDEVSDAC
ncbi:hypothetical protein [Nocardia rhizosphaerae]|uniref:Uncharacterized protein n=1 Tax=Nocardia rhizosphaerae TaxID=1691571 RepID=A0ABV8L2V0_9NOCA